MAYTVTKELSVFGNKRAVMLKITADAATQTVATGLKVVDSVVMSPSSLSTAAIKIYKNTGAGGTATAGSLGISGCANGDVFEILCLGK